MVMHKVVMVNESGGFRQEAVDHVPDEDLKGYVDDARARWQTVTTTQEGTI